MTLGRDEPALNSTDRNFNLRCLPTGQTDIVQVAPDTVLGELLVFQLRVERVVFGRGDANPDAFRVGYGAELTDLFVDPNQSIAAESVGPAVIETQVRSRSTRTLGSLG